MKLEMGSKVTVCKMSDLSIPRTRKTAPLPTDLFFKPNFRFHTKKSNSENFTQKMVELTFIDYIYFILGTFLKMASQKIVVPSFDVERKSEKE